MEDGIESYQSTLLERHQINDSKKYIYAYLPQKNGEKIIVLHDKIKAIEYSKEKNCRIDFFEKEIKGFYKPLNEYAINGIVYYC